MTNKEKLINSLFDRESLIAEIVEVFGSYDESRWSLDANMNEKFDAHVTAGKPYDEFYINEEGYVYQSCWNCATNSENDKYTAMRNLALEHNYKSAIDYGCAIGTGVVMLALEGLEVTGADICKPCLKFLEARKNRHKLDTIQLLNLNRTNVLSAGKFDLLVCTEVFEHVEDPVELAWQLASMVKVGGRLILSWSFVDMTSHVQKNFHYNTPHPDQLETVGFGKVLKDDIGLELDRAYGNNSGYLWFNNNVWIKR